MASKIISFLLLTGINNMLECVAKSPNSQEGVTASLSSSKINQDIQTTLGKDPLQSEILLSKEAGNAEEQSKQQTNHRSERTTDEVDEQQQQTNPLADDDTSSTGKSETKNDTQPDQSSDRQRCLMDFESIALSLRATCEMNRRLMHLSKKSSPQERQESGNSKSKNNIIASVTTDIYNLSDKEAIVDTSNLSNLSHFVKALSTVLGYDDNPIIPAIALIYLDRACSVENKSFDIHHVPKRCPYLIRNTVHKLFLASIILACRTVRNQYPLMDSGYLDEYTAQYASLLLQHQSELCGLDVSKNNLGSWLNYMVSSLGSNSDAMRISTEEVDRFLHRWRNLFEWEINNLENNFGDGTQQLSYCKETQSSSLSKKQGTLASSSSDSTSSWEKVYDQDEGSLVENQDGNQMLETKKLDDYQESSNQQPYNGGELNYQSEDMHFSHGSPSFDDGDIWW